MSWVRLSRSFALIAALLAPLALAACEEEGPAEQAGETVDEAVEETGEAIEEGAEDVQERAD